LGIGQVLAELFHCYGGGLNGDENLNLSVLASPMKIQVVQYCKSIEHDQQPAVCNNDI
jgi:hypothetical protein